jgi:hypothetical protein
MASFSVPIESSGVVVGTQDWGSGVSAPHCVERTVDGPRALKQYWLQSVDEGPVFLVRGRPEP